MKRKLRHIRLHSKMSLQWLLCISSFREASESTKYILKIAYRVMLWRLALGKLSSIFKLHTFVLLFFKVRYSLLTYIKTKIINTYPKTFYKLSKTSFTDKSMNIRLSNNLLKLNTLLVITH